MSRHKKIIVALSAPLALMVVMVSMTGIYTENFYINETLSWQVQSLGQDIIDLVLVVPVLTVTTLITLKNRAIGFPIWGGVILYLIYTFAIYSFDVHFNTFFVFYCLILGFAFYAFLFFGYSQFNQNNIVANVSGTVKKVIGIYFIVIAVLFYFLWLSEILPAILSHQMPKILRDAGLPTNPVHVLDLAIILPGIFITGFQLLRNKKTGFVFTPVFLMFFILMDITIASLSVMMVQKGLEGSLALSGVMVALAFLSLVLLIWYIRSTESESN